MRILLLHSSSDNYGASKIFLQTVTILKQHGHFPVVVLSNKGALVDELLQLGVEVHIVNLAILRRKYFNLIGIFNRYKKWMAAVPALNHIIDTHQIDTIYSNTAAVLIGGYIAKKRGIQHIWHLHEIIEQPVFMHWFFAWCLRNWANKIIVVSKAVEANWQDALPKQANANYTHKNSVAIPKMFQIYNGILPVPKCASIPNTHFENYKQSLGIPENALVIGMAARIHFWKGQTYFIEIARELLKREVQYNEHNTNNSRPLYFLIAGDPFPGYEYLQIELVDLIKQYRLTERILYIGFVKEMDLFYKSIDVLILPSQQPDPLPTVVLEAMQYAIPVVATTQGGALEMIIENETGIFIPLDNVSLAVEKITKIISPATMNSFGEAGKKRVETYFSAAVFKKNIIAVFENI
jgi:glycosyltransferase involved in cell wall biosynthesis